jgi:putative ABC transport system permease protein
MMAINTFRIALRHLRKQKLNTALHITGLTLGMSVCLLIALFIQYELSFDTFHKKADRTYRVNSVWTNSGRKDFHFSTPVPMADALRRNVPGLDGVALAHPQAPEIIEINPEKKFLQSDIMLTTPELADIFTFEAIRGDVKKSLAKPYTAVITESTAKKFFGNDDPVGKTFRYKNQFEITVGCLIRDLPGNTHLPASMLLSYIPDPRFFGTDVDNWNFVMGTSTFVVVPPGYDMDLLQTALNGFADKHINSSQWLPKDLRAAFDLQPLKNVHFQQEYGGGGQTVKAINTRWLWFFGSIGLAVLIIACINFMNLSTAQALTRAREVGVRKAIGAQKGQLLAQFIIEAWILAAVSGVLALIITGTSLPSINTLIGKKIPFSIMESPTMALWVVAGVVVVGILAGFYPAWIITKFNPVNTLKSGLPATGVYGSTWMRKSLMVVQFSISTGLLISVLLISEQLDFLRNKDLGFDKENILNVRVQNPGQSLFANELAKLPQVKDLSFATATPSNEGHWSTIMSLTNGDDPNRKDVTLIMGDDHFCTLYDLDLLAGRFLLASDTNQVANAPVMKAVVNETLVRALAFKSNDDALAKKFWIGMDGGDVEIVGVVKDFNTGSLHQVVQPALITQNPDVYGQVGIRIVANADYASTIAAIESAWKKIYPDGVFEYKFLDEQIDAFYKEETRLHQLFRIFSGLAMLISCLGLWGLSVFTAQQRTKEIGIRKVLGASVNTIVVLLSKDFFVMAVIALVVSSPVAWYFMNDWLTGFAFRIDIGWHVFAVAGILCTGIALLTISSNALKAALANPAESLRTE